MKQTRINTFETNSSSVHSLCIMEKSLWDKFKHGEKGYYFSFTLERVVTEEEKDSIIKDYLLSTNRNSIQWLWEVDLTDSLEEVYSHYRCLMHEKSITTEHGDEIIAVAFYCNGEYNI